MLADEICAWDNLQETYDMAMMGLRLGDNPQIVITSTPKPIRWLREMAKRHAGGDPTIRWINGSTKDNSANLAKTFITQIITRYEGTRLGLQELEGKLLTESDNALWTRDLIDRHRVDIKDAPKIKDYKRIVVSVDPAVTAGDRADHVGIMVAGQRADDDTVDIMRDLSEKLKTHEWAMRAVSAYHAYYADAIVAEVNNGGDMVEHVIRSMPGGENIPIRKVFATKGKYIRAEPVAMLYEQNRVRHIGMLEHLETEMVTFETLGGAKSPDRLDAMVWAVTDLLLTSKPWKFR